MSLDMWRRVTKKTPCGCCQKPDWCMISDNGFLCMRVPSDRPYTFSDGSQGWIHSAGQPIKPIWHKPEPSVYVDCEKLMDKWRAKTKTEWVQKLADNLGVKAWALWALGVAWAAPYNAFAWPMSDGGGKMIGIRLRAMDGRKWAVTGTHSGIFLPKMEPQATMYLVEGATDTAAAITLGLFAIGRPSCSGGVDPIVSTIHRLHIKRVVEIADNDGPGIRGAVGLTDHLPVSSCILVLCAKDLREFVKLGGDKALIDSMVQQQVWRQPHNAPPPIFSETTTNQRLET